MSRATKRLTAIVERLHNARIVADKCSHELVERLAVETVERYGVSDQACIFAGCSEAAQHGSRVCVPDTQLTKTSSSFWPSRLAARLEKGPFKERFAGRARPMFKYLVPRIALADLPRMIGWVAECPDCRGHAERTQGRYDEVIQARN